MLGVRWIFISCWYICDVVGLHGILVGGEVLYKIVIFWARLNDTSWVSRHKLFVSFCILVVVENSSHFVPR